MFIIGGFNAYPAEIENMISDHPAVSQAAIVGVPDDRMGEVGCVFIVLRPGSDDHPDELHRVVPRADGQLQGAPPRASGRRAPAQRSGKVLKYELRGQRVERAHLTPVRSFGGLRCSRCSCRRASRRRVAP